MLSSGEFERQQDMNAEGVWITRGYSERVIRFAPTPSIISSDPAPSDTWALDARLSQH